MSSGGGDSEFEVNINLTALLDVLTNLLFFLLMGFSSSQATMQMDKGITLPNSSARNPPTKDLEMSIGREQLSLEKEAVVQISNGRVVGAPDGRIETLFRRLSSAKEARAKSETVTNDVLLVLCDKKAPYGLLHQVLNTAAEAGFAKFRMVILTE